MLKQNLRAQMRSLRSALDSHQRQSAAKAVNERLRALCFKQNWPAVAVYMATAEELNLEEFIAWLLARGVPVYAPRGQGFAPLESLESVTIGQFGVREPRQSQNGQENEFLSEILPENLIFLVPGLAFDKRGGRLGFGGGWYDRALAPFPKAPKIGVAFDFQIVGDVPREAHDILMNAIITPMQNVECQVRHIE